MMSDNKPYLWRSRHHDCDILRVLYVPWGDIDGPSNAETTIVWWD